MYNKSLSHYTLLSNTDTVGTLGDDVLTGTVENDLIISNGGSDVMQGNGGNDKFVFDTRDPSGHSVIRDYHGADSLGRHDDETDTIEIHHTKGDVGHYEVMDLINMDFSTIDTDDDGVLDSLYIEFDAVDGERNSITLEGFAPKLDTISISFIVADELFTPGEIVGSSGDDVLTGTAEDDRIISNGGSDVMQGNGGNDKFVFDTRDPSGHSVIRDYHGADSLGGHDDETDTIEIHHTKGDVGHNEVRDLINMDFSTIDTDDDGVLDSLYIEFDAVDGERNSITLEGFAPGLDTTDIVFVPVEADTPIDPIGGIGGDDWALVPNEDDVFTL